MDELELQQVASHFAAGLEAVEMERRSGPDWDVFKVRSKVFMLMTDLPGRPVVILKADPNDAVDLRREFPDITAGYHMNKTHWITLRGGGSIDEKLLQELVGNSYRLVVKGLSKAEQQRLGSPPATVGPLRRLKAGSLVRRRADSVTNSNESTFPESPKESPVSLLRPGDPFPALGLNLPGGENLTVPDAFAGNFAVVLFYRGSWCPYCNAQLRAFHRASDRLEEAGIKVAASSTDDETAAVELADKLKITFPLGHSADALAISAATGAFVSPTRGNLESTGFVLDPFGKVVVSVYSSGAIGRLMPDDVIGMVRHMSAQRAHQ